MEITDHGRRRAGRIGLSSAARWMTVMSALAASNQALAYVGPGVGLSAIGSIAALAGAVLFMVAGFVWYPIKRLLKRRRPRVPQAASRDAKPGDDRPDPEDGTS